PDPDVQEVTPRDGQQEAGRNEALHVRGGRRVRQLQPRAINENLAQRDQGKAENEPPRGHLLGPGGREAGQRHQTKGGDRKEEAHEDFGGGWEAPPVRVHPSPHPAEEWHQQDDEPRVNELEAVRCELFSDEAEVDDPVHVVAGEEGPETVVLFVGKPEEDHQDEDAEERGQDLPLLTAFFRRLPFVLDYLYGVVTFTGREGKQGGYHEPGRKLKRHAVRRRQRPVDGSLGHQEGTRQQRALTLGGSQQSNRAGGHEGLLVLRVRGVVADL